MRDRPISRLAERNLEGVQAEIAQEKAAALARMGGRLDDALRRLAEFTAADHAGDSAVVRDRLVSAAAEALWYYVVQREACGLRDTERVLRELSIPREVHSRMGVFSPSRRGNA